MNIDARDQSPEAVAWRFVAKRRSKRCERACLCAHDVAYLIKVVREQCAVLVERQRDAHDGLFKRYPKWRKKRAFAGPDMAAGGALALNAAAHRIRALNRKSRRSRRG